jgi:hypothetical protein
LTASSFGVGDCVLNPTNYYFYHCKINIWGRFTRFSHSKEVENVSVSISCTVCLKIPLCKTAPKPLKFADYPDTDCLANVIATAE